jgi:hypothetical protein
MAFEGGRARGLNGSNGRRSHRYCLRRAVFSGRQLSASESVCALQFFDAQLAQIRGDLRHVFRQSAENFSQFRLVFHRIRKYYGTFQGRRRSSKTSR